MGITVVVVSHDVKMLMNLSDLVTVLNFGEKIAEGRAGGDPEGSPGAGGIPWRPVGRSLNLAAYRERATFHRSINLAAYRERAVFCRVSLCSRWTICRSPTATSAR